MAREKLDPRPFADLPAQEQLDLKRQEDFVREWNELQYRNAPKGTPLGRIPTTWKKPAGRPEDMSP